MKWLVAISSLMITLTAWATSDDSNIVLERLMSPANICVVGDPCAANIGKALMPILAARTGEQVYNVGCAACHTAGAAGAPKTGIGAAWESRLDQGMETLVKHAVEGYNAMPARGLCADCSDQEVADAVSYMVDLL